MKIFSSTAIILLPLILFACTQKDRSGSGALSLPANPVDVEFGDPFILKASDGMFYMYGTSDDSLKGFKAYSSADLRDWTDRRVVYRGATDPSWTVDCFWAPEVYERDGKYYLWFSANWKHNPTDEWENFRIGVAVANSPTGPFVEMGGPIFDPGYPIIDANLLLDDPSGRVFLYYSRCCYKNPVESEISHWALDHGWFAEIEESWIYGIEIEPDFSGVIGEPVLLLRPPVTMDDDQAEWESRSVTSGEVNRRWTEGSYIFRHGDLYYMMYSANYFGGANYAVGYATATHPLGPFTKSDDNPVLEQNVKEGGVVSGTGHCMALTLDDGRMLCVYHARTEKTGNKRMVFIDEMEMFTYAMITGVKNGWLDKRTYGAAARKAWLSLLTYLDEDYNLRNVCVGTGTKNSHEWYMNRPRQTGDLHGQAAIIWCAYALSSDKNGK